MDEIKEAPEKQTFVIDDDNKANWAFRKLAEVKHELDIKAQQKAGFDEQTKEWYESETKSLKESQDYFEQLIEQYRQTQPDGKVKVPAGYTSLRHAKQYQREPSKLLPFVEKNYPDLLKKDIKWADFKKQLTDYDGVAIDQNGEKVPGITVIEKESVSYHPNKLESGLYEEK